MDWNALNMDKTNPRIITHLRHPVDNWVRKHSKKIFQDDGGLCRVLMEGKAIIIFAFKVRGKFICLMFFLRILNCCHNNIVMSFITIPFQLPSIKTYMLVPNLCNTIKKRLWLSGSSKCGSSNVCAALGSGLAMRSMANKEDVLSWWLAFGLTAEAA